MPWRQSMKLIFRKIVLERVAVVELEMNKRGGGGAGTNPLT